MSLKTYTAALDWLGRGWQLLPIQPGTKYKAKNFGRYLSRLTNGQQAREWFFDSSWNLGVVAPDGSFILDFDNWDIYLSWLRFVKRFDDRITRTYTEITPADGAHVFLSGDIPVGFSPIDGVEIKRDVVVAPSLVGREYEVMSDSDIYSGTLDACFFSLSRSSYLAADELLGRTCAPAPAPRAPSPRTSCVDNSDSYFALKQKVSILDLARKYFPKTLFFHRGDFATALCPFHGERRPSFWVNTQKNIFGCHSCKVRGDVINFYALAKNIDNKQAVKELMMSYA